MQEQLQGKPTCLLSMKEESRLGENLRCELLGGNVVGPEKQGYTVEARR